MSTTCLCTTIRWTYWLPLLLAGLTYLGAQEGEPSAPEMRIEPSGVIKVFTNLVIPEGEVREGNFRVIGGDLTVGGKVTGNITVLGGDVRLLSTANIQGTISAIGGSITRDPQAQITGEVVEVRQGKLSLTREETDRIFDSQSRQGQWLDRDEDEDADEDGDDEQDWDDHDWDRRHDYRSRNKYTYYASSKDFGVPADVIFRYNRAEGVGLYIPFSPETYDIPGFRLRGYVGRAFGPGKWYGRIAIGEFLAGGRIGAIVEGHLEATHNDGWRVAEHENTLGALMLGRDWFDWYETEGASANLVLRFPSWFTGRVRYVNEFHKPIDNLTTWTMAGQDHFRPVYAVASGRDVALHYEAEIGRKVGYDHRRFRFRGAGAYRTTVIGSEFEYDKLDLTATAYLPLHRRLGVRLASRFGDVKPTGAGGYGLQHQVQIGGIGTVEGYDYKMLSEGNTYGVIDVSFSLHSRDDILALTWKMGNSWSNPDGLASSDLINQFETGAVQSIGVILGDEDTRLEFHRAITTGYTQEWVFYFRLLDL